MIKSKQYTVVDVQEMPPEIKKAVFIYFCGRANDGFYKPHIDGCPIDDDWVTDEERAELGDSPICPATMAGAGEEEKAHSDIIIYLFKELNLSFDDVPAWDRILIKYWW